MGSGSSGQSEDCKNYNHIVAHIVAKTTISHQGKTRSTLLCYMSLHERISLLLYYLRGKSIAIVGRAVDCCWL